MLPPANLLEVVELLREQIDSHRDKLPWSEPLTRYVLIDTMLRELGWDTGNPDMVRPEYDCGGGKADYALMVGGKPFAIVEAKKLYTPLIGSVVKQVVKYSNSACTDYAVLTDGKRWEVYDMRLPSADRRVAKVDLVRMPSTEVCKVLSALKRPSARNAKLKLMPVPKPDSPWRELSEWSNAKGEHGSSEMRFPDHIRYPVYSRDEIVVNTVKWLNRHKKLHKMLRSSEGISKPGSAQRYIVACRPMHQPNAPMQDPVKIGKYYVDREVVHHGPVELARHLMIHAGHDPDDIEIRYMEPHDKRRQRRK